MLYFNLLCTHFILESFLHIFGNRNQTFGLRDITHMNLIAINRGIIFQYLSLEKKTQHTSRLAGANTVPELF